MKLTLRQLEIFVAVARHQNVSRAANQLALSQSATSAALTELERLFDAQLFDRVGKRIRLNELGNSVLPHAAELIDRARELETMLHAQDAPGELQVGATLTIGNYLGTLIVSDFMQRHPGSKITLDVENTAHIIAKVASFDLDLGLVEGRCQHPDIEVIPWGDDTLEVFAAPHHPLAKKRRLTPADLAAADWIVREPGSGTRETFDLAVASGLPEVRIKLALSHTEAIKRAVESGLGIGCISRLALREAFRRGSLVQLKVPFLKMDRKFFILVHKQKYRTATSHQFIELCRQHMAAGLRDLMPDNLK
ncbi:MAG: LysR substrate-binding domain-containing protein [Georgfuchsia sp.]